jgi:hypothetical protein
VLERDLIRACPHIERPIHVLSAQPSKLPIDNHKSNRKGLRYYHLPARRCEPISPHLRLGTVA